MSKQEELELVPVTANIGKGRDKETGKPIYFRLIDSVKPKVNDKHKFQRLLIQQIRITDLKGNDIDLEND